MSEFLSLVQANGVLGLIVGSKGQKQAANAVLSILLGGVSLLNPESSEVIVAAIASIFSALAYEFIRFLAAAQAKARANKLTAVG